jgi:hypothetical protein
VLLFSPEVQLLLFANAQLPALSMLIALIKALLTVCTTLSVEKNLISEITFSEAIAKGTGDIVIKESGGTITFATLGIQSTNITIGGTDNKTLTIPRSFGNSFTKCCNKITIWRYRAHSFYCDCRSSCIYCNSQNSRVAL